MTLERIIEYFNSYAFVHVSIYGFGYIEAAKKTWDLVKRCGFAAYFNDCLVEPTITFPGGGNELSFCDCGLGVLG